MVKKDYNRHNSSQRNGMERVKEVQVYKGQTSFRK